MGASREGLSGLPYWPRMLSREQAAAYVGVSARLFDQEVREGRWPAGIPRGAGRRLTWDRVQLDARLDNDDGTPRNLAPTTDSYEVRRAAAKARKDVAYR
jgi:hypothetical protein